MNWDKTRAHMIERMKEAHEVLRRAIELLESPEAEPSFSQLLFLLGSMERVAKLADEARVLQ